MTHHAAGSKLVLTIDVERAEARDALALLALRESLEEWLERRGVVQWGRGQVALQDVQRQIAGGDWWVVRRGADVTAALRLLWSDEPVWQHDNAPAAYVHGLMVDRASAGGGLGAALLAWAEARARAAGVPALRLDCVESNSRLRDYYAGLGFTEVGRRDFDGPWHSAVLLEKVLAP